MVLLSLFATVAVSGLADGWQIHQAEQFCYLSQSSLEPGGSELGIALDASDRARIILSNAAWQIEAKRNYPLAAGIEGAVKSRKARGLRLGNDWIALVAELDDPNFIDQFAKSSAILFEVKKVKTGTVQSRFTLAGTAAAAKAMRACQADLIVKSNELDKQKLDQRKVPQPERHNDDPDDNIPDR